MHKERQKGGQLSVEDPAITKMRVPEKVPVSRFDPYQGTAMKKPSRKRDLRKIGEWLETKRRTEALKHEDGSEG
jgi:hypothetical protein